MITLYRAMSNNEAKELQNNHEQYVVNPSLVTYWTNCKSSAELYMSPGKTLVEVQLDREVPKAYHGIAEGVDGNGYINNHHEIKMSRGLFNDQLVNLIGISYE